MPKTLLIVRHAKSDWGDASVRDINRPLNARGHRNAPEMANRLKMLGYIPQQLVSSHAVRAYSTAQYFASAYNISEKEIIENKEAYEAFPETLLKLINQFDDSSDFTALFSHNPGISGLVQLLSRDDSSIALPTCGVVVIRFDFDTWNRISAGTGELIYYDYPKSQQQESNL